VDAPEFAPGEAEGAWRLPIGWFSLQNSPQSRKIAVFATVFEV